MREKICKDCKLNKSLDEFYTRTKKNKQGEEYEYAPPYCKDCTKTRSSTWQKDNRSEYLEKKSSYHKERRINDKSVRDADAANGIKKRDNGYYKKYQSDNLHKFREYSLKRMRIKSFLQSNLTLDEKSGLEKTCYLTSSVNTEFDHFIPVSWGHGGDYLGNVYYLDSSLNSKKKDRNPFVWAEDMLLEGLMEKEKWNCFIEELATFNGLTAQELIDFTYWCENSKRSIEDLERDNTDSLILWKRANSLYVKSKFDWRKVNGRNSSSMCLL